MKEAIRMAYRGGYKPQKLNLKFDWEETGVTEEYQVDWRSCVVDPLFWQCLGKALGWTVAFKCTVPGCKKDHKRDLNNWLKTWHHFIDHLANGGNVDEFFNNLLQ